MVPSIHRKIITWMIFLFPCLAYAQDIKYAKMIIEELTAPEYAGRGYVDNGHRKAAKYISNQFKQLHIIPFTNTYSQTFSISVNTFPDQLTIEMNDSILRPGMDYIVDPASPSLKGIYKTVCINSTALLYPDSFANIVSLSKEKFLVVDNSNPLKMEKDAEKAFQDIIKLLKYHPGLSIPGIVLLTKSKLLWNVSTIEATRPLIIIHADSCHITPIEKVAVTLNANYVNHCETQNIVGYLEGNEQPDSFLVFTAHYDHLGRMGKETYFPGANDNASGIAMLLNLAQYFSVHPPFYSVVFIALGAEEAGLLGAKYFVEHPLFEIHNIKFLINFDLAGTGDNGIQVVNGIVYKKEFDLLCRINDEQKLVPQVKIRGEACNSDHCMFYQKNVPCFFIYTLGGISAYHDINDRYETLPLTEFEDYVKLMIEFCNAIK